MATSTLGSGTLVLAGTTSGTTTVTATAVAGTTTLTLPAATDTLVGRATTDTLTNKTLTTPSVSSPTISDGTANGVAYLNGSKVLTTGSALTFSGSALAVTGSISSTGGFTSNTTITAQLDGSDSAGAGPGWNLFNTAFSRGWRTQLSASNNKVDYYFNGSAYVQMTTLNTNGALALSGASTSANGVGITFPVTQSASTEANTLDDYEEGSWTPTISGDSTAGTGTYTFQQGAYTKVGRLVTVQAKLGWSAHTGIGNMLITNLPFSTFGTNGGWPASSSCKKKLGYFYLSFLAFFVAEYLYFAPI